MCETILVAISEADASEASKDVDMFKRDLLPQLLALSGDKVANIRSRVGICFQVLQDRWRLLDRVRSIRGECCVGWGE